MQLLTGPISLLLGFAGFSCKSHNMGTREMLAPENKHRVSAIRVSTNYATSVTVVAQIPAHRYIFSETAR